MTCLVWALLAALPVHADATSPVPPEVKLVVHNQVVSPVSPLLFGQFLERNTGEPGPESALVPGTAQLRPDVLAKLKSMDLSVVRFPGGTEIDFEDWRNMIDNVPGREGGRPVTTTKLKVERSITNRFGYDEYFAQLRDPLGWQTDVVLNFLDAVAGRKPIHQAAIDACGLVAYLNAPVGAKLPEGMPDWPAVRAKNGHPAPYGVQYVQIGNETWIPNFKDVFKAAFPDKTDDELAARYLECLKEYIAVIRQIDPAVKIVIDLREPFGAAKRVYADPYVLKNVNLMAYHVYQPGTLTEVQLLEKTYPSSKLSPEDLWAYWTMLPAWPGKGQVDFVPRDEPGLHSGLKIAVTEWNWRGWGKMDERKPFDPILASALGAARTCQGLIRAGDRVEFATQSMLVGAGWRFAAVFFLKDVPDSARFSPQGQTTNFYRHTVGDQLLKSEMTEGLETMLVHVPGSEKTVPAGAWVDALASRGKDSVRVHVINRRRDGPLDFSIRLDGFGPLAGDWKMQGLVARKEPPAKPSENLLRQIDVPVSVREGNYSVQLPEAGIYVIEIPLAGAAGSEPGAA